MSAITTSAMHNEASTKSAKRVYHVGPWRQAVGWMFAPPALGCAVGALFADKTDDRAALLILAAIFLLITLFIVALIRRARLEIGPDGVVLRQVGYRLESSWTNVVAIRGDRGHEGFVTAEPVGGKNAGTLAAAATLTPFRMYSDSQQSLLEEHRLIPIEAFAWHLRKGTLRRDIRTYAPHLAGELLKLDAKPTPEKKRLDRRSFWVVVGIIAVSLAWTGVIFALGERFQARFFNAVYALLDPFYVLSAAMATYHMYKRRTWLFTILMGLMTVIALLWTLVDWMRWLG